MITGRIDSFEFNFEPDQGNNLETSAVLSLYENNGCEIEKLSVKEKWSNCDFLNIYVRRGAR